jgi:Flp pilus assembly protein TadD
MRLHFGDFRFAGFGNPQVEFEQATAECDGIKPGWPAVWQAEDAICVPFAWSGNSIGDAPIIGGLYNADGSPTAQAAHLRHPNPWPARALPQLAEELTEIQDEVVYGGVYFGHFGHFTLESMSRLWLVAREPGAARVLFQNLNGYPREPHAREVFAALGLAEGRLLAPRHPVRLRSVRVPEQAFVLNTRAFESHRQTFTTIGNLMGVQTGPETEQPLYLSRSALARHQRRIINEPVLEEMLERNGFRVFHPERHSLRRQLEVLHRHKYLFGPWGSAFRPALFSPRTKVTCQFMEAFPKVNFLLEARLSGAQAWFVKTTGPAPLSPSRRKWEAALWFDLDRTMEYLKDEGFVRDLAVPNARLEECIDQAAAESIFVRTYALARRGRAGALNMLERALSDSQAEPAHRIAFDCALAEAELAGGNAQKAEGLLQKVAASGRADSRTHFLLSMALVQQGRLQDAVAHASRSIALQPNDANLHHHLGNLLRRQGDLTGAETAQRRALQLDPQFVGALRQLAGILANTGKLQDAIGVGREAVTIQRYDTDLLCDLASVLAQAGHLEEAEQQYLAALRLDAGCGRAQTGLQRIRVNRDRSTP